MTSTVITLDVATTPCDRRGKSGCGQWARAANGMRVYKEANRPPCSDRAIMPASDTAEPDNLETLLHAAGRGDRQAFAKVYALAAPTLFAIALRMARQRPLAEEVLQDAFLSIWRKAGQYHPDRGQPMAWMVAIVRNRAIDRLRSEGRNPTSAVVSDGESEIEAHTGAFEPAIPREMADSVRGCVERLQNNYRRSILLAYYYGLTHEELAARLDAPLGTVKSWVRRGILQLRECLEE